MSGRPGLLRTVLEAQETRGLTRSDDISRLLPAGQKDVAEFCLISLLCTCGFLPSTGELQQQSYSLTGTTAPECVLFLL